MLQHHKPGRFQRAASLISRLAGNGVAFGVAVAVIVAWSLTGPLFGFSDTWQLVINTSTTIVTFLMVFLIQNTQNRDALATQLKLDELIRATRGAHNVLLDLEEREDSELARVRRAYRELASHARAELAQGHEDTGIEEISVPRQPSESATRTGAG